MMRSYRILAATVLVSAALTTAACGKKKVATPAPPPPPAATAPSTTPPAPPPPAPPPPAPAQPAPTEEQLFTQMTLDELNAKGVLADAFFAYDSVEIGADARTVLQKNTDYLKRWATTKVVIEGHTDSRGTNEYNLALSERRAVAAHDYVVSLGIPTDRITTVSKGEEQPVCREETEDCWQKNRRAHFVFTAK